MLPLAPPRCGHSGMLCIQNSLLFTKGNMGVEKPNTWMSRISSDGQEAKQAAGLAQNL
jgi:hypothetical protein